MTTKQTQREMERDWRSVSMAKRKAKKTVYKRRQYLNEMITSIENKLGLPLSTIDEDDWSAQIQNSTLTSHRELSEMFREERRIISNEANYCLSEIDRLTPEELMQEDHKPHVLQTFESLVANSKARMQMVHDLYRSG
jgi:hypothetical protein